MKATIKALANIGSYMIFIAVNVRIIMKVLPMSYESFPSAETEVTRLLSANGVVAVAVPYVGRVGVLTLFMVVPELIGVGCFFAGGGCAGEVSVN
jgi:hypothetical protein